MFPVRSLCRSAVGLLERQTVLPVSGYLFIEEHLSLAFRWGNAVAQENLIGRARGCS